MSSVVKAIIRSEENESPVVDVVVIAADAGPSSFPVRCRTNAWDDSASEIKSIVGLCPQLSLSGSKQGKARGVAVYSSST